MRLGSLDGEKKTAPKWRKHGDSKRLRRDGRVGRGGRQTSSTTLVNGVREVPLVAPGSWEQREKRPKRKEKAGQKRYCSVVEGNIYEKGWVLRVPTMGRNCTGRLLWFIGLLQILRKKSSTRVVYGFLQPFRYLCSYSRWCASIEQEKQIILYGTVWDNFHLSQVIVRILK